MQLFYTSNPNATILEDDEFFHCTKVLRNRENDNIFLTDGRGNLFESKILKIKKNHCEIKKLKKIKTIKKNNTNHVVCSIIKSQNRLEWMIEKLTEIGIDEITFISTKYSEPMANLKLSLSKISCSEPPLAFNFSIKKTNEPKI